MDSGMSTGSSTAVAAASPPRTVRTRGLPELRNENKLLATFAGALGIDPALVDDGLSYNSIPQWDSVGHMAFVTEVEALFEIMLDAEDIVDMSSYGAIRRILRNYGVQFEV